MKILLPTIIASLAALAIILLQTPTAEASIGTITVTVQDFHGNPLPGAYVCLKSATGCYQAITNNNGVATFNNMTLTQEYDLNVTYLGVMVRQFNAWKFSEATHPKTLRTGVFNVRVCAVSAYGEPVPGARIEIRSTATEPDLNREATAGGDGCVSFSRLPGNGTIYIYNATYVSSSLGVTVSSPDNHVSVSENNYNSLSVELPLYRFRLTLKDRGGSPVQGLTVSLWRGEKSGQPQLSATSDSGGRVVFGLLPGGSYYYEVSFRGEAIHSTDSAVNINSNKDDQTTLPLTRLTVEVFDLKNRPLTSYTKPYGLEAALYVDSRLYAEATGSGVLSFGYVYDERDYLITIKFEGQEVYSGIIRSEDIKSGRNVKAQARFGDFTVSLDTTGLLEGLQRILVQRAVMRLGVGDYSLSEQFRGAATITLRDQPLVTYTYTLLVDGIEVGSGELTPRHGETSSIRPTLHTLSITASSLDERPVEGVFKIIYGAEELGSINIGASGGVIEGILALPYRYSFRYRDVEVASGELRPSDVASGTLRILASVGDVRAKILDNAGEEPLAGAFVRLEVGSYRADSVADSEGLASFRDAPLATGTITIQYQGVKVYSSPITYSPEQRSVEIKGTGVYTITFKILDSEGEPLTGAGFKLSVGTLSVSEKIGEEGELTLKLIPNGTLSLSVDYMGVGAYSGSHRPLRNGELVEIVAKVYRLQIEVYAVGAEGRELLKGAQLLFEREEKRLAEASTDSGRATLKLPAGDYTIRVNYKGVPVADRLISLTGAQKVVIDAAVYEFSVKIFGLDGNPIGNLTVKLLREGSEEPIEELKTNSEGVASTIIPGGLYNIVYGAGGATNTVRIPVKSASSQTLLYGEASSNSLYPLIAAPALIALSIYGLLNSIRVKPRARQPSTQQRERRGASEWVRRSRERLRKNV